jgi:hypothetical protein
MRYRKLRIAWSVCCAIACVLLIALWVRSYWWWDQLSVAIGSDTTLAIESMRGDLVVGSYGAGPYWDIYSRSLNGTPPGNLALAPGDVRVPERFLVLLFAALAAAPWLPWWSKRFSLRTLLIATTLIAVVLGLIVAVLRWPAG